jgi:alpha-L-rhamnosidase
VTGSLWPVELRLENATNPLGLETARPRFSWQLVAAATDARDLTQSAYRLIVGESEGAVRAQRDLLWDSGEVAAQATLGIDYDGPPLVARTRYWWTVRTWDQDHEPSDWSAPAWWEMGLNPSDWQARWIGAPLHSSEPRLEGCPRIWTTAAARHATFSKTFNLPAGSRVLSAQLAGSDVSISLNGERVTVGADVRERLRFGQNVITVGASAPDGLPGGMVLRLLITLADQMPLTIETDDTWLVDDTRQRAVRLGRYGDPPWGRDPVTWRPSPLFRTPFKLDKPLHRARLYASALGVYELHLNGQRVGRDVLAPGWTDYPSRVPYQAYDVTDLVQQGDNVVAAIVGDGWYSGYLGFMGPCRYGSQPLLIAQLEVEHADGSRTVIATNDTWRTSAGEIIYSDQQMGETVDARAHRDGWDSPGVDDADWQAVSVHAPRTRVEAEIAPRMAVQMDLAPVAVSEPAPGTFIFDLGQIIVGWARLTARGERGRRIILRFAEVLNPDGTLYTANLRSAQCTDEFILRGGPQAEVFEPRFTHHGFRYVEVTGYPGTPTLDALTGRVVFARMPLSGSFECSNPLLNRLQENIQWGQRGNFLSVPTDCPQRDERLGWTGDAQVFCATAAYNMDVQQFMGKWLVDAMDAQLPSGAITHFAPIPADTGRHNTGGAAGWADAIVVVPWTLYWIYGDRRILQTCYAACARWIEFMAVTSTDLIRPAEGFGDWLSIDAETPKDLIGTAYFAYSAGLMSRIAEVLGRTADARHYADLSARVRQAFRQRFVRGGGRVEGETQTAYVLALYTGMLEPEEEKQAAEHLLKDIEYRNCHLSTGFLGTPWLLPVLTQTDHLDAAYRLLMQETQPSWLFPVKHGATTMWERWDSWSDGKGFHSPFTTEGLRTVNMNSFNHYAYGCVGDWLYRTVAGIECLAPGYERIRIRPRPGGDLTWVRASYDSVRGPIRCSWRRDDERLLVDVEIPPNTTAEITLPGCAPTTIGSGRYEFAAALARCV